MNPKKTNILNILALVKIILVIPVQTLTLERGFSLPNILNIIALVKIILVIPVQTLTLERGFSLMKIIKSDWSSRLQPKTLTQLMSIKLNGPTLQDFNPLHAIAQWWKTGSRRLRTSFAATVHGQQPHDYDSSDSESSDSEYSFKKPCIFYN